MYRRALGLCVFLFASPTLAFAHEALNWTPIPNARVTYFDDLKTQVFEFDSPHASGVHVSIGPPDARDVRVVTVAGCGTRSQRTVQGRITHRGRVFIAFESDLSFQREETCSVELQVYFTNETLGFGEIKLQNVGITVDERGIASGHLVPD